MDYDRDAARRYFQGQFAFETDPFDLSHDMESTEPPIVVDVRPAESHRAGHIPGAVNIPYRTIDPDGTRVLDANRRVVVYCNGIGCNAAKKAAVRLIGLGFRVQELDGGIVEWKRQGHQLA